MFSAMPAGLLSEGPRRDDFAARVRQSLVGYEPLAEHVRVWLQFGHTP